MKKTLIKNSKNKRKDKRFACAVPVEMKQASPFSPQTVDISKNGIGLISPQSVRVNQKIAVELVFNPETDPVLVLSQVLWVKPIEGEKAYRVGLTFSEVLHGSKSRVTQYFQTTAAAESV